MKTIRVAQINILNSIDGSSYRYENLMKYIKKLKFDIVLLQEIVDIKLFQTYSEESELKNISYSEPYNEKFSNRTAIISRFAIKEEYSIETFGSNRVVHIDLPNGKELIAISAHLPWGGNNEGERFSAAIDFSNFAKEKDCENRIILLGGDFNSDDDSVTNRFLSGKEVNPKGFSSTFWTDFYQTFKETDKWQTSDYRGYWGSKTAKKFGLDKPEFLPIRRIDYLKTYQWNFGSAGGNINFERFGSEINPPLSDHYGIYADMII